MRKRAVVLLVGAVWSVAAAGSCTVSSTGIKFGGYDPLAGAFVDSVGTVTVSCTGGAEYSIALSSGHGSYAAREMRNETGQKLHYNLYGNVARNVVWGDGSAGSSELPGSFSSAGGTEDHSVYGRIPESQNPVVGSYSDSIVVTVSF